MACPALHLGDSGLRASSCRLIQLSPSLQIRSWPRRGGPIRFVVDSGASFAYINRAEAIAHGIAIPSREMEIVRRTITATGPASSRVRVGRLRGWWNEERQGHPMEWPVFIRMDDPPGAPALLGLGGVVRLCRWVIDGTPTPDEPFGFLAIDDLR